jgi:hypothetical protein
MSDLQCPSILILLTPEAAAASDLSAQALAGVVVASSLDESARAAAERISTVHACPLESSEIAEPASVRQCIGDLADLHRGETLALVAPSSALRAVIEPGAQPVKLAVDSDGWRVLRA